MPKSYVVNLSAMALEVSVPKKKNTTILKKADSARFIFFKGSYHAFSICQKADLDNRIICKRNPEGSKCVVSTCKNNRKIRFIDLSCCSILFSFIRCGFLVDHIVPLVKNLGFFLFNDYCFFQMRLH